MSWWIPLFLLFSFSPQPAVPLLFPLQVPLAGFVTSELPLSGAGDQGSSRGSFPEEPGRKRLPWETEKAPRSGTWSNPAEEGLGEAANPVLPMPEVRQGQFRHRMERFTVRLISSTDHYRHFLKEYGVSGVPSEVPQPGEGQMLVVVTAPVSACSGSLWIRPLSREGGLVARIEITRKGACEKLILLGSWIVIPEGCSLVGFEWDSSTLRVPEGNPH